MAKRSKPETDEKLPVRQEWVERVVGELMDKRGAQAKLAEAVGMSTGQLAELLAQEQDGTPKSKYSKYVKRIDAYFGWPSMAPMSPDTQEVKYLLDGIGEHGVEVLRVLKDMDAPEREAFVKLILARKKS